MIPLWLSVLAWISLIAAFLCAGILLVDVLRRPQRMAVMNWVWPIMALYAGPLAIWAYWRFGRRSSKDARTDEKPHDEALWESVLVGVTHCGAGCTLGDIIAEFVIFFAGLTFAGSILAAEFLWDFVLAYIFGIVFQYYAIAPMRGLSLGPGLWAAVKADTLSLTAFEIGLFGWMALTYFVLFRPHLTPAEPTYWLMMQVGMLIGFATSYPMNWWLMRVGIKEAM